MKSLVLSALLHVTQPCVFNDQIFEVPEHQCLKFQAKNSFYSENLDGSYQVVSIIAGHGNVEFDIDL